MKVVLFCGGQGLRLREYSENVPKPMVPVGYRPMLWHLMKFYAHHGHTDFILCLGHQADVVKNYFVNYDETVSNDFILHGRGKNRDVPDRRGRNIEMLATDIHDWTITFVDTGQHACVGERLKAVQPFLEGEDMFLANYADNLSDVPMDRMIEQARRTGDVATFVATKPAQTFHTITAENEKVTGIYAVTDADMRINGGYFVLTSGIWDVLGEGEELVLEPFQRLIEQRKLGCFRWDGFWACMDTFKEKQTLDELDKTEHPPWKIWLDRRKGHMQTAIRETVKGSGK